MKNCGIADAVASAPAVLCAYSGGADSSVLLHFLASYLKEKNIPLYAAHMNHMIRGDAADADEEFCRRTCEKLGIPFFVKKEDIPTVARKRGEGLEECARKERYAFLNETAERLGGALIATAHNATDNMETVIFNLVRGTSVHGLGGITPVRDGKIIRPLLFLTSEEIREFAESAHIEYVTDKTNFDTDYTRNLIRHTVVPTLRKINPRADSAVLRLSQSAREDDGALTQAAESFIAGRKYIPRGELRELDISVLSRVIMLLCGECAGRADISEKNISQVVSFALSEKNGQISLPKCTVFLHKDSVFVKKSGEELPPQPKEIELEMGKYTDFGEYTVGLFEKEEDILPLSENIYNLFIQQILPRDKIDGKIFIRTRRQGDTFAYKGKRRKLKKLMCDENIPQRLRDRLPLICSGEEILYVPLLPLTAHGGPVITIFRKKEG